MITKSTLPILYTYRRCPYAMRARMALKLAEIDVEMREISLREKPAHMLQVSPKGTVPILILEDGTVLDESLAIMQFAAQAYAKKHIEGSLDALRAILYMPAGASLLITHNDTQFKRALDGYKYPEKFTEKTQNSHRAEGEIFLAELENLLQKNHYLLAEKPSMVDIAIFPFIRQFAAVDVAWWEAAPYPNCRAWLNGWMNSEVFNSVMQKQPTYFA